MLTLLTAVLGIAVRRREVDISWAIAGFKKANDFRGCLQAHKRKTRGRVGGLLMTSP